MLARERLGKRCVGIASWALLAGVLGCPEGLEPFTFPPDASPVDLPEVIALAGADLVVLEGQRVQLDGHASRALGDNALSLAWSQIEGPPVLLTNPTSGAPAFIAPLAPARLQFRLRAESGEDVATDEVTVEVRDIPGDPPLFLEVPADAAGEPGESISFSVDVIGADADSVSLHAEAVCSGAPSVAVAGQTVTLTLPEALPCVVVVDGEAADGRRTARAARVLWPPTTPLISETRPQAPVLVEPGSEALLRFEASGADPAGVVTRAWPSGGTDDGLSALVTSTLVTLAAPLRRTRMFVGTEKRRGSSSGGVRYVVVDVSAGAGNRAPVASGGNDRVVRPGASFSFNTTGTYDLDLSPEEARSLVIDVDQVLGAEATRDSVQPSIFRAPDVAGTLLFHVTAFDQRVFSDPDSVRVVVDPEAESRAPVLSLPPIRYVSPGETFLLDASSASDPDSGFIERYSITQSPGDPVMLLAAPVPEPRVELVAGADGDAYHFRLTVFDEDGLTAYADVEVQVERAGPYVDAGATTHGNGTPDAPFPSIESALPIAERHQLRELRLAAGPQAPFGGALPDGLSLRGGFELIEGEWVEGASPSQLPVIAGGVILTRGDLSRVHLSVEAADASLQVLGQSVVSHVVVSEGPLHTGPLVVVAEDAIASLEDVHVEGSAQQTGEVALVHARAGASVRVSHASINGGPGGARSALRCDGATVDLKRSSVTGATAGASAIGVDATGCDIQIVESTVAGGAATGDVIGLRAVDTNLFVAPDASVIGASSGAPESATALEVHGDVEFAFVSGLLDAAATSASAATATGMFAASRRVQLADATVRATSMGAATGVRIASEELLSTGAAIEVRSDAEAIGITMEGPADIALQGGALDVSGRVAFGVRATPPAGLTAPRMVDLVVNVAGSEGATGLALDGSREVTLDRVTVLVDAGSGATVSRAVGVGSGVLRDGLFEVSSSGDVIGLVAATQGTELQAERIAVAATSDGGTATGVLAAAAIHVASSFVRATGQTSIGLEARAGATLRHVTLQTDGTAARAASSSATLDLANSALFGVVGVERGASAPPLALAASLAFGAAEAYRDAAGTSASSVEELTDLGICDDCMIVEPTGLVDETGHLVPGDNPLVDSAHPAWVVELDIDGELRPQGLAADIGCDERSPPGE